MAYEIINGVINRPVLNGNEYDHLFPFSKCEIVKTSSGYGCKATREVIAWSRKYVGDTRLISEHFVFNSLQQTCNNIQYFLYSHIQYSYNDKNNIKSPSCVWASKQADCKSYSVFASSILLNLGIYHYLRVVRYNDLGEHIYVVVPINQETPVINEKSKFKDDYFIIDGTTNEYNEKKIDINRFDILMNPNDLESEPLICVNDIKTNYFLVGLMAIASVILFSINDKNNN